MFVPSENDLTRRILRLEASLPDLIRNDAEHDYSTFSSDFSLLTDFISSSLGDAHPRYSPTLYAKAARLSQVVHSVISVIQEQTRLAGEMEKRVSTGLASLLDSARPRRPVDNPDMDQPMSQTKDEFIALRRWFLAHLDNPYPDKAQKAQLRSELGLPIASITQFFTNIRRRTGWMRFMQDYGYGRMDYTAALIRCIESGAKPDPDYFHDGIPAGAREAVARIREYVSAGLEQDVRDGIEEAIEEEMKKIEEEKKAMAEAGMGEQLPARKRRRVSKQVIPAGTATTGVNIAPPAPARDIVSTEAAMNAAQASADDLLSALGYPAVAPAVSISSNQAAYAPRPHMAAPPSTEQTWTPDPRYIHPIPIYNEGSTVSSGSTPVPTLAPPSMPAEQYTVLRFPFDGDIEQSMSVGGSQPSAYPTAMWSLAPTLTWEQTASF